MNRLKEILEQQIMGYSKIGHPAILERFVLDNGLEFKAGPLPNIYSSAEKKQCFANAGRLALANEGLKYVEGYALIPQLDLPFHHAWAVDGDNKVIDPTWNDSEHCVYWGVPFQADVLREQILKTGHWGVLLTRGEIFNLELMHDVDPGFFSRLPPELQAPFQEWVECLADGDPVNEPKLF